MAEEKIFANGLIYKGPREGAPDFVKGSLSFKVEDFVAWLTENQDERGWVNVDIKESKGGKLYCEKNTWKPKQGGGSSPRAAAPARKPNEAPADYPAEDVNPDDIPF